jgi:RHS repeat-associated protein
MERKHLSPGGVLVDRLVHLSLLVVVVVAAGQILACASKNEANNGGEVVRMRQAVITDTGTDLGSLSGEFSVSHTGVGSYTVPLWTPQGRNEMSPRLALGYSSGGGDSPLGLGWSLQGGTSTITRCVENSRRGNRPMPVLFVTEADQFCLDGQPLILVSGTHGMVGAEYRTEPDTFSKIVLDELDDVSEPSRFTVSSRDGLVHSYGTSRVQGQVNESLLIKGNRETWGLKQNPTRSDDDVQATHSTPVYGWLRGSVRDRFSNHIYFRYLHPLDRMAPGAAQEPLLEAIEYVEVAGFQTRRIELKYVERPDPASHRAVYVAGMPFKSTKQLASIDALVAGPGSQTRKSVRFYRFTHETSASTKRPRLRQVEECDGNPATVTGRTPICKKPTIFGYSEGIDAFSEVATGITDVRQTTDSDFWGLQVADMNNDGKDDIVYRATPPGGGGRRWYYRPSTGTGFGGPVDMALEVNGFTGDAIISDFTRHDGTAGVDGLPDILVPSGMNTYAHYRNLGGGSFDLIGDEDANAPNQGAQVGDMSGRGQAIFLYTDTSSREWVYRTTPEDVLTPRSGPMGCLWKENFAQGGWSGQMGDIDGDGAVDFLTLRAGSTDYLSRMLQATVPAPEPVAGVPPEEGIWDYDDTNLVAATMGDLVKYHLIDVNGDGLPDALRIRQGETVPRIVINAGNGFLKPAPAKGKEGSQPVTGLDGTSGNIRLGTGTAVRDLTDVGIRVFDYDGDGKQDILLADNGVTRDSSAHPTATTRSQLTVLVSRNGHFEVIPLSGIPTGKAADGHSAIAPVWSSIHNYRQTRLLDANGDGLTDIVQISPADDSLRLFIRQGKKPDLLVQVRDGMGAKTSVAYLPMISPAVYTPGSACDFPQVCQKRGAWLVSNYALDNGVAGEQNELQVTYEDARVDVQGGGSVGFAKWTTKDLASNTTRVETFDVLSKAAIKSLVPGQPDAQVYSKLGAPTTTTIETVGSDFRRIVHSTTTYEFVPTNNRWSYYTRPLHISTIETETKTGASPIQLSARTRDMTYDPADDNFGLTAGETVEATTAQGVFIEEWSAKYRTDAAAWVLGQLTETTAISTAPGVPPVTRKSRFQSDPHTGAVLSMEVEPDDLTNDLYRFDEFVRNQYGQLWIRRGSDHLANQRTETHAYDAQSVHLKTVTNSLNHVRTFDADPGLGVLHSFKDANNVTTSFSYDGFGRLRRVNYPGGGGMSLAYARVPDPDSTPTDPRERARVTTTFDGGGETVSFVNRVGQQVRVERKNLDASFSFIDYSYNELGLLSGASRPASVGQSPGPTTSWIYDEMGRLKDQERPEEAFGQADTAVTTGTATRTYDAFATTMVDEVGRQNRLTEDGLGRVVKSESKNEAGQWVPTEFTYGPFDVLRIVTRRNGSGSENRVSAIDYDVRGRRTSVTDPDTGTRTFKFNAFGEVRQEVDAAGSLVTYVRDALGRVKSKQDKDGTTTFVWDTATNGKGKLAETNSSTGVKRQFFYDSFSRMNREIWTVAGSTYQVDYAFDSVGRVQKVSYPSTSGFTRLVVRNTYDADSGELSKVQNDSSSALYWQLNATEVDGQTKQEAFGNNVKTDYEYSDSTGRVRAIKTLKGTSSLRHWDHDYWADGNLRRRSDLNSGLHERFQYDGLDRIKNWLAADSTGNPMSGGWSVNYTIDDFGNLTRRHFVAGPATGGTSQDLGFQLFAGTNRVQTSPWGSYTYDANGQQTGRPDSEGVVYTAFGLPKQITGPRAATFLYDAFGGRARKRKSDTNLTVYVAGLYEKRINGSSTDHVMYVTARGRTVAQVMRRQGGSESVQYLHADRLGSVDTVTDSSGVAIEQTKRDPFGNKVTNFNQPTLPTSITGNSNKVRLGFTGHEQDDELGLVNMRGRMFDPRLGRFISPDPHVTFPLLGQSYNRFAYVVNNPLRFTDPTGFDTSGSANCADITGNENYGESVCNVTYHDNGDYTVQLPDGGAVTYKGESVTVTEEADPCPTVDSCVPTDSPISPPSNGANGGGGGGGPAGTTGMGDNGGDNGQDPGPKAEPPPPLRPKVPLAEAKRPMPGDKHAIKILKDLAKGKGTDADKKKIDKYIEYSTRLHGKLGPNGKITDVKHTPPERYPDDHLKDPRHNSPKPPPPPEGRVDLGRGHNHPGPYPKYGADMSDQDRSAVRGTDEVSYIGTSSGEVLRYDPRTGWVISISPPTTPGAPVTEPYYIPVVPVDPVL